jgi:phosphatidylinositol alpha-1,6-mannosyltransferase
MEKIKQNFILFTLEYPPQKGGVAKYYENLANNWPNDNFYILSNGIKKDLDKIKFRPLISKLIRPRWLPSLIHLYKAITSCQLPIANCHIIVGQILPLGISTYILSRLLKFKYSVVLHGLDFSLAMARKKITTKILSQADKIICANSYTANLVKTFNSSLTSKISVVNPGIESTIIRNPQKTTELIKKYKLENKTILFGLGRLVKRKGFDQVIKALKDISSENQEVVLAIGGTGPEEENLKKLASDYFKENKELVIFLGKINDEEYWAWLELCDIFIMTSRNLDGDFEGFGIVYLEANLAGKPVIAGDSGGVREAVINNVTGLLVDPENTKAISEAITNLVKNKSLRDNLGASGNRRVVETLSAKKQTEKIYNLLNI